jgi:uncharacterized protein (TIGR02001 family)
METKGAGSMNKVVMSLAALMISAAPAFAADMPVKALKAPVAAPSPWDVAFGVAFTSDYVLRGISQSNRLPAVQGYFEVDYTANDWLKFYAGVWGSSLTGYLANAEIDPNAGVRFTFGNFGLDIGAIYYYYPDGTSAGLYDSFLEGYIKPSYKFNDWLTVGAIFDGGNNFNNGFCGAGVVPCVFGSKTAYYYSGNATITLPWQPAGVTVSLNPELGRQVYECNGCVSYTYWDVGLIFNYKIFTLDLRYWDTNAHNQAFFTSPVAFGAKDLAASRFVATFKIDTTFSALK